MSNRFCKVGGVTLTNTVGKKGVGVATLGKIIGFSVVSGSVKSGGNLIAPLLIFLGSLVVSTCALRLRHSSHFRVVAASGSYDVNKTLKVLSWQFFGV